MTKPCAPGHDPGSKEDAKDGAAKPTNVKSGLVEADERGTADAAHTRRSTQQRGSVLHRLLGLCLAGHVVESTDTI
jgi:hypothetical protein